MNRLSKIISVTLLVSIDALTKAVCLSALAGRDVVLIEGILSLKLVLNTGAAFSFLSSTPGLALALSGLLTLAILVCLFTLKTDRLSGCALSLMAAGGLGNLIDRVFRGAVTDMISVDFISFPVFNFADICVTAGAFLLVCALLFTKEGEKGAV